jgi:hypothetical protein
MNTKTRVGSACREDRLGVDRFRDRLALKREGARDIETRFVIGLFLLKHNFGLSDDGVCDRRVCDPYFEYFTGEDVPARVPARALGPELLA